MFVVLVYFTVLVIATCGLVYEFIAGTLSSYLLGNSITHYSLVIGVFLSALGLGAYLSGFIKRELARHFIEVELGLGLVAGLSTPILFASFVRPMAFVAALYALVLLQGVLVGLEVPLVIRILRRRVLFQELIARALAFDYIGALFAGLLFSFVLLPHLGLIRTGIVFGLVNALVGLAGTWLFASWLGDGRVLRAKCVSVVVALVVLLGVSERLTRAAEAVLFADPIIYAKQTRFQRIVVTSGRGALHLYLDGNLQFSSGDEYRYHEALVHPLFSVASKHENVLVLGGGDGLAVREILRYPDVKSITLVDIDRDMTSLARTQPLFVRLNADSLGDPRVRVVNDDAMAWMVEVGQRFDAVVIDFPDPNNYALGKLYTTRFYKLLGAVLDEASVVVIQATSPLVARNSFWCVVSTLEAVGLQTLPYHAFVPSFGEWGFVLASKSALTIPTRVLPGLRYLSEPLLPSLFVFSPDMSRVPTRINSLNTQALVRYYDEEWRRLL